MIVLTSLLAGNPDPQRGLRWTPSFSHSIELSQSIDDVAPDAEQVILSDILPRADERPDLYATNLRVIQVQTPDPNPYFARWMLYDQFLQAAHLQPTEEVWAVDISDVKMLRRPQIEPGYLYVGYVARTISDGEWLPRYHRHPDTQAAIKAHGHKLLLNPGTVGADAATFAAFTHDMASALPREGDLTDMGAALDVMWGRWANRLRTGPVVVTDFKEFTDNGRAWWQHK